MLQYYLLSKRATLKSDHPVKAGPELINKSATLSFRVGMIILING